MSRGVYRSVYSRLYDDDDYQRLSPRAKLVLLTARQCEQAGPGAIYRYYPELLARQTGLTVRQVGEALEELDRATWTVHDDKVLWVRNGLRYDPIGLRSENYRKAVLSWLNDLPKSKVVVTFCRYYELPIPSRQVCRPSDDLCPPKEQDSEVLQEQEQEQDTTSALPPAAPAPVAPPSWGTPEQLVALYNRLAPNGHPRVTRLSPARRSKARAYLREFPEQTFWTGVFSEIALSRFLQHGSRDRPEFRGDFDWLLTKGKDGSENAVKVYEGKYRDKEA